MNRRSVLKVYLLASVLGVFLVTGCIESPLLHHATASESESSETLAPAACPLAFPAAGLCASLEWARQPIESESGTFILRFWRAGEGDAISGPFVDPNGRPFVKLWMPSMGHGSSPVQVAQVKDAQNAPVPGVFEATQVYFVMPGRWEIWVQLKQGSQILEQAKLDVEI